MRGTSCRVDLNVDAAVEDNAAEGRARKLFADDSGPRVITLFLTDELLRSIVFFDDEGGGRFRDLPDAVLCIAQRAGCTRGERRVDSDRLLRRRCNC